jgi:HD superfamily phosphohydrolase
MMVIFLSKNEETTAQLQKDVLKTIRSFFIDANQNYLNNFTEMFSESQTGIYLQDDIYKTVFIPKFIQKLMDTPSFQRLHYIKQLAMVNLIYPGANHTRFSHSIGVFYLVYNFLPKIISNSLVIYEKSYHLQNTDLMEIQRRYFPIKLLRIFLIACLCHDIGHPPLSHLIETILDGKHQKIAYELLNQAGSYDSSTESDDYKEIPPIIEILEEQNLDRELRELLGLLIIETNDDIFKWNRFKELCEKYNFYPKLVFQMKNMLHYIFDRLDYLMRDAKSCGVCYGEISYERLCRNLAFNLCKLDGVNSKNQEYTSDHRDFMFFIFDKGLELYQSMLSARYKQYKVIYYHKTNRIIQKMVCLALKFTNIENDSDIKKKIVKSTDDFLWNLIFKDFIFSKIFTIKKIYEIVLNLPEIKKANQDTLTVQQNRLFAEYLVSSIFQRNFYKRILTFHPDDFEKTDENDNYDVFFSNKENIKLLQEFKSDLIKKIKSGYEKFKDADEIEKKFIKNHFSSFFIIFDHPNSPFSKNIEQIKMELTDVHQSKNSYDFLKLVKKYLFISIEKVNKRSKYNQSLQINNNTILTQLELDNRRQAGIFHPFRVFIIRKIPIKYSYDDYQYKLFNNLDFLTIKKFWNQVKENQEEKYKKIPRCDEYINF